MFVTFDFFRHLISDDQKKYAIGARASYYMPYNNDIVIDLGNDIGGGINFLYNVTEKGGSYDGRYITKKGKYFSFSQGI